MSEFILNNFTPLFILATVVLMLAGIIFVARMPVWLEVWLDIKAEERKKRRAELRVKWEAKFRAKRKAKLMAKEKKVG